MNIIISPDTYVRFFNTLTHASKTELEVDIHSLITNSNNKQILSKALLNIIENSFSKDLYSQLIAPFVTEILDHRSLNIAGGLSEDFGEVVTTMCNNHERINLPYNIDAVLTMADINKEINRMTVVINDIVRPSFNWLLFKLACYNPMSITLRYFDFQSNEQVKDLIDGIVSCAKMTDQPIIFDRQVNLDHNLYDSIKRRTIHYYTAQGRTQIDTLNICADIRKELFRARIYLGHRNNIHERKLIVGNYIIESDEDFWSIKVDRTTWKLDFTYCPKTVGTLIAEKQTKFRLVRDN